MCRGEGTVQEPLYHPCKCSGSIRFVHQEWYVPGSKAMHNMYILFTDTFMQLNGLAIPQQEKVRRPSALSHSSLTSMHRL